MKIFSITERNDWAIDLTGLFGIQPIFSKHGVFV
jgi:hypothetical protein